MKMAKKTYRKDVKTEKNTFRNIWNCKKKNLRKHIENSKKKH